MGFLREFVYNYDKFGNLAARKDNINNVEKIFTYDNYVYDPTCQHGFNRYAYCFYNPLKYIDPTGESCYGPSEAEKMQRAANEARQRCWNELYRYMEEVERMYQSIKNNPSLWEQDKGGITHCNTTSSVGNFTHGTNGQSGTNNCGLLKYANLALQSLPGDVKSSIFCMCLGIKPGQPIPENLRNDAFLKQFQQAFVPDAPMDIIRVFTVENVPEMYQNKMDAACAKALTKAGFEGVLYSGTSEVYFNSAYCFASPEELYDDMGHELVHVSQYAELSTFYENYKIRKFKSSDGMGLVEIMEYYAYTFNGSKMNSFSVNALKEFNEKYPTVFKVLNYINYEWTRTMIPRPR